MAPFFSVGNRYLCAICSIISLIIYVIDNEEMRSKYLRESSRGLQSEKIEICRISAYNTIFQILWKSWCHILVTLPSHMKKLRSILKF